MGAHGNGLVIWLSAAGPVLVGIGMTWKKVLKPLVRGVQELAAAATDLRGLLTPDPLGRLLPDRMVALEEGQVKLQATVAEFIDSLKPMVEAIGMMVLAGTKKAPQTKGSPRG